MKSFKELREKTLTPAEKKKREEIAKAIEKDEPDMPMDKKMAIATAQAKKVAEGAEKYTVKKGNMTRKVDGATADKMKRQGWKLIATEGLDEGAMSDFHLMVQEKVPAEKIAKELGLDLKTVKKLMKDMKESVELDEARKDASADLYFDTYSAAVQHAKAQAEKKGFEVVEDDWFNQVTTGKGKPGRGKTTRHTLKLTKNDKPVRQGLSIQVYNRDSAKKPYELNFYVS